MGGCVRQFGGFGFLVARMRPFSWLRVSCKASMRACDSNWQAMVMVDFQPVSEPWQRVLLVVKRWQVAAFVTPWFLVRVAKTCLILLAHSCTSWTSPTSMHWSALCEPV